MINFLFVVILIILWASTCAIWILVPFPLIMLGDDTPLIKRVLLTFAMIAAAAFLTTSSIFMTPTTPPWTQTWTQTQTLPPNQVNLEIESPTPNRSATNPRY